jgi:hypothetical protein
MSFSVNGLGFWWNGRTGSTHLVPWRDLLTLGLRSGNHPIGSAGPWQSGSAIALEPGSPLTP